MIGFGDEGMDDGDGESIGGIVGLRHGFEAKVETHHFLHLGLVSMAIAGNGHFDLVRSVLVNRHMVLFSDEQADAASFGDRDAGSDILFEKELFDGHDLGVVKIDNFVQRIVDVFETVGQRSAGRSRNDAVIKSLVPFDHAEAADAGAGVDAEDPERLSVR